VCDITVSVCVMVYGADMETLTRSLSTSVNGGKELEGLAFGLGEVVQASIQGIAKQLQAQTEDASEGGMDQCEK
jgi:hypothetical protein